MNLEPIRDLNTQLDGPIPLYEIGIDLRAYLAAEGGGIAFEDVISQVAGKDVAGALAEAKTIQKATYDAAIGVLRPRLQRLYADCFSQNDLTAIVLPTTPLPARPINEHGDTGHDTVELNGKQEPTFPTYARNTAAITNAGLPGLSVPIGVTSTGLPVGIELDGPVNSDRTLLAVGLGVEREFDKLPPPNL